MDIVDFALLEPDSVEYTGGEVSDVWVLVNDVVEGQGVGMDAAKILRQQ